MCKSHHPNDLAPGIVVIQNEFLSPLLPCASAGVTTRYKTSRKLQQPVCWGGRPGLGWGDAGPYPPLCPASVVSMCKRRDAGRTFDTGVPLCLWATHPNPCRSLSGEPRRAQFVLGLIGKMSDMLKVALGFMQSQ